MTKIKMLLASSSLALLAASPALAEDLRIYGLSLIHI